MNKDTVLLHSTILLVFRGTGSPFRRGRVHRQFAGRMPPVPHKKKRQLVASLCVNIA